MRQAPHITSWWNNPRITLVFGIAVLPAFIVQAIMMPADRMGALFFALLVAMGWPVLFAKLRHRHLSFHGLVTALIFLVLLPVDIPLWQQVFALSFGVVLGEQVFGGYGRNFINPAVLALAFLFFSFQIAPSQSTNMPLALATLPGAVLLLVTRWMSWRVISGMGLGLLVASLLVQPALAWEQVFSGYLIFGMVFLAGDPVSAASTNAGRWIYGLLVGALIIILGQAGSGPGSVHAIVFATLLGSIFAPLIDYCVVALSLFRRRRHYE